ncbi:MAG: glutamate--cysteine ligase [Phycisphaera sp.]|nr:glutamate--cysteine ligase [Phycisphaera sp.]
MADARPIPLFEAVGVEIEHMLVDSRTLDVRPVADALMQREAGHLTSDVEFDDVAWSNELAMHVIELKTNTPAKNLASLNGVFEKHVRKVSAHAQALGTRLMPTAMHPWMDPHKEFQRWPHDNHEIYRAFDAIFDCRGHGWANLQSTHINLPFANDDEFGRLHAAIRLVLPMIPALAASSPIADGRRTGIMDTRLETYRHNADRVPSVAGSVIPEPIFTIEEYHEKILERIYADMQPMDTEGILRDEWCNSRGAIARFVRNTIEVRVIDVQECPKMDIAIASVIVHAIRLLVEERWCSYEDQKAWGVDPLVKLFNATVRDADHTVIADSEFLRLFGVSGACSAMDFWRCLIEDARSSRWASTFADLSPLETYIKRGSLSKRILDAVGEVEPASLKRVYTELCDGLVNTEVFRGE